MKNMLTHCWVFIGKMNHPSFLHVLGTTALRMFYRLYQPHHWDLIALRGTAHVKQMENNMKTNHIRTKNSRVVPFHLCYSSHFARRTKPFQPTQRKPISHIFQALLVLSFNCNRWSACSGLVHYS